MFSSNMQQIVLFLVACTVLILILISLIAIIVYRYQQKQHAYLKQLEELKVAHENAILHTQLEIQEQTFQNISREIHDNIGQKLTLAKLHLNTLDYSKPEKLRLMAYDSANMISEAIIDLTDISRSMSSEIVLNNGLAKAIEFEIAQFEKTELYEISLMVSGNVIYLETSAELGLFRIVQEALNNILKHSDSNVIKVRLEFYPTELVMQIVDNGKGFEIGAKKMQGTGLINMCKRARALGGNCSIDSTLGVGTSIKINIPLN